MKPHVPITLLAVALALAGCSGLTESAVAPLPDGDADDGIGTAGVSGKPGGVGGSVANTAPDVTIFTPSETTGENRGLFTVTFTGEVRDVNTERQLANLTILASGPATIAPVARAIAAEEKDLAVEPAAFTDGWKVWAGEARDGVLHFKYQHTFPAFLEAGVYEFTAGAADASGATGESSPVAITLTGFSDITVSAIPVSAAGEALASANWGAWSAEAGATNVESTNFMKLVNTGAAPDARVVIDFAPQFVGAEDAGFTIPAGENVQFAWWEDTSPATSLPSEGTYEWLPPGGTATVTFTGVGHVIYVTYRIVQLPEILPVQPYGITFTVTDLADL